MLRFISAEAVSAGSNSDPFSISPNVRHKLRHARQRTVCLAAGLETRHAGRQPVGISGPMGVMCGQVTSNVSLFMPTRGDWMFYIMSTSESKCQFSIYCFNILLEQRGFLSSIN